MSRKQREQHANRRELELMYGHLFDEEPYPWCEHGILVDLHCPLCAIPLVETLEIRQTKR